MTDTASDSAQPGTSDPRDLLAELRESVASARAMPFSASCVVNRGEILDRIDALGMALPARLAAADALLAQGQEVVEAARMQAQQLHDQARAEVERRLAASADGTAAAAWAADLRRTTEAELAAERSQTENLVDSELAHLEAVLVRTAGLARAEPDPAAVADVTAALAGLAEEIDQMLLAVRRGRERVAGRDQMEDLGDHVRAMDAAPDAHGPGLGTREELG